MSDPKARCRHNKNWIIAGGYWLWCYECGAIRTNQLSKRGKRAWTCPTGPGGINPAMRATRSEKED